MNSASRYLIVFSLILMTIPSLAQRIFYTEPDKDDYRQMNFEIIGRVGGNINIYKNFKARHDVSIYDNEMKQTSKTRLEFLPERVINVDFVVYPDFYWMIYQHQKRNVVYCSLAKMDGNGKLLQDPIDIDTSHISGGSDSKVYSMVASDDKKQIMIFKINRRNEKKYMFTLLRFNGNMKMEEKNVLYLDMPTESIVTEFNLDNDGELVFGRTVKASGRDFIKAFDIVSKRPNEDRFALTMIPLTDKSLDEIKIKPDNLNKHFVINSFYYKQKKGNIDGMYNLVWDKAERKISSESSIVFGDTLRVDAKSENTGMKQAFNDYFIKQVISKRDGGFVVFAEMYYTTSRGNTWNRWDYLYGYNYFTPLNYLYYSPYNSLNYWRWSDPFNRFGANSVRHYTENILVLSYDANAQLQWSNIIHKNQFDDNSDMLLSYQIFNTGGEVKFLFNNLEKRDQILTSVSMNPEGQQKREPTMRNLDRNYQFMPRYGKQVGARQVVLPCMYKNYICFSKIDF